MQRNYFTTYPYAPAELADGPDSRCEICGWKREHHDDDLGCPDSRVTYKGHSYKIKNGVESKALRRAHEEEWRKQGWL